MENKADFRTAINDLSTILLENVVPKEVKRFDTERTIFLVNTVKQIDKATQRVVQSVEQQKRTLEREIKQHKRLMEKMFSSVESKPTANKERFAKFNLKNWQVSYSKAWNLLGWTGKIRTEQDLRTAANEYNRTLFRKRLSSLLQCGLLTTEGCKASSYMVTKLSQEVLNHDS